MIIRLFILIFVTCCSFTTLATSLDYNATDLKLQCPTRGVVEVTFHMYNHASEKWGNQFQVGSGHTTHGDLTFVRFSNGDVFMRLDSTDEYLFRYVGQKAVQRCRKLSEHHTVALVPDRLA